MLNRSPRRLSFRVLALAAFALAAAAGGGAGVWLPRQAGEATAVALVRAITLTSDIVTLHRSP